jgi:hypothetical protein
MFMVLGVVDLVQGLLRSGLGGCRKRVQYVGDLVSPAPLMAGLGKYLGQGIQKPSAPSPTRTRTHSYALESQQFPTSPSAAAPAPW